jgi:hypothetical protein
MSMLDEISPTAVALTSVFLLLAHSFYKSLYTYYKVQAPAHPQLYGRTFISDFKLSSIPTVGASGYLGSYIGAWYGLWHSRELIAEGYSKVCVLAQEFYYSVQYPVPWAGIQDSPNE